MNRKEYFYWFCLSVSCYCLTYTMFLLEVLNMNQGIVFAIMLTIMLVFGIEARRDEIDD